MTNEPPYEMTDYIVRKRNELHGVICRPALQRSLDLVLHAYCHGSTGETEDEEIRLWILLTDEQCDVVRLLASDLNWLNDPNGLARNPDENDAQIILDEMRMLNWVNAAKALYDCPRAFPRERGMTVRSQIWEALGRTDIMKIFDDVKGSERMIP
jgi:hypothetical protein